MIVMVHNDRDATRPSVAILAKTQVRPRELWSPPHVVLRPTVQCHFTAMGFLALRASFLAAMASFPDQRPLLPTMLAGPIAFFFYRLETAGGKF